MSLIRWNPARELASWPSDLTGFQREINRLFDNFFRTGFGGENSTTISDWTPAVDIAERENDFKVKVELPGVQKNDVQITLESNVLTIKGEKRQEKESGGKEAHRVERLYGAFQRSFTLPATVQTDKIEAAFTDGVLSITLPKAEEARPRQIEVKVK